MQLVCSLHHENFPCNFQPVLRELYLVHIDQRQVSHFCTKLSVNANKIFIISGRLFSMCWITGLITEAGELMSVETLSTLFQIPFRALVISIQYNGFKWK